MEVEVEAEAEVEAGVVVIVVTVVGVESEDGVGAVAFSAAGGKMVSAGVAGSAHCRRRPKPVTRLDESSKIGGARFGGRPFRCSTQSMM